MKVKGSSLRWVVGIAGAGIFGWFVWPTPYEYTRKAPDVWRVNRFTGEKFVSNGSEWRSLREAAARERAEFVEAKKSLVAMGDSIKTVGNAWTEIGVENRSEWKCDGIGIVHRVRGADGIWKPLEGEIDPLGLAPGDTGVITLAPPPEGSEDQEVVIKLWLVTKGARTDSGPEITLRRSVGVALRSLSEAELGPFRDIVFEAKSGPEWTRTTKFQ